jgi:hypothetical protein
MEALNGGYNYIMLPEKEFEAEVDRLLKQP